LELILCGKNIQSQKHFNDVPLHRHTVVIDLEMATDAKGRTRHVLDSAGKEQKRSFVKI
jgi:stress response protein YsnF